jgi:hypothetical protein
MKTEYVGDVIGRDDVDKYLWDVSKRLEEVADHLFDLNNQIQSWTYELKSIQHELGSYDPDLDEPDLHGKEEFDRAVEGGDTDGTLP